MEGLLNLVLAPERIDIMLTEQQQRMADEWRDPNRNLSAYDEVLLLNVYTAEFRPVAKAWYKKDHKEPAWGEFCQSREQRGVRFRLDDLKDGIYSCAYIPGRLKFVEDRWIYCPSIDSLNWEDMCILHAVLDFLIQTVNPDEHNMPEYITVTW